MGRACSKQRREEAQEILTEKSLRKYESTGRCRRGRLFCFCLVQNTNLTLAVANTSTKHLVP
jgi:hypothetical protein